MIIAIDGPAGSGKSTIARLLAQRLDLPYLDTGAMYRAVALVAIRKGIGFEDETKLAKIAAETIMQFLDERDESGAIKPRVEIGGLDETSAIRTPEVSQGASKVGIYPGVRERLVSRQRNWTSNRGGGVVDGRDVGTVVFPEADLKIFLTADPEVRMKRRMADGVAPGFAGLSNSEVKAELAERDTRDSSRAESPLAAAPDAFIIDTTKKDIEDVAIEIMVELRKRSGGELPTGAAR